MSVVLRRYLRFKSNKYASCGNGEFSVNVQQRRNYTDKSNDNDLEFVSSTILVENGFNVQELPVVVRKLKNMSYINDGPPLYKVRGSSDSNYKLIQAEFQQCLDLREVFSLLSKCTKITPNIALGAMERINKLDQLSNPQPAESELFQVNSAKGAILDKLLRVVMNTEDTPTILNILNSTSYFMEPYKFKFSDELLLRASDGRLSVEQLCQFMEFIKKNKTDLRYSENIDKLWIGFVAKEADINENNLPSLFKILPEFKVSKKTILNLSEQKFSELWNKINVEGMQDILNIFMTEKHFSLTSYSLSGRWLSLNIHALDDDTFLEIITKFTRLKYNDEHIERAIEKYMRLKSSKIENYVIILGVLNYCMQFHLNNVHILNSCSEYLIQHFDTVPYSFLKCLIYPFGFLNYCSYSKNSNEIFWNTALHTLERKFERINVDDLSSIILAFIYTGRYPLKLAYRLLSHEYLTNINNMDVLKKLHVIDNALSVECSKYSGPLLPKEQWSKPISQDRRIINVLEKTKHVFEDVAGGIDKLSFGVLIPYVFSDDTYVIDVMFHPSGFGSAVYNEKMKSVNGENTAILIHLPDHYCSDNIHLVGPQKMRIKHLQILGLQVVSLQYTVVSKFYTTRNISGLQQYLVKKLSLI